MGLYFLYQMRPLKRGQDPIFKRPRSNSKNLLKNIKSLSSLQLPNIYSKSLKMKIPQISLESSNDIRKQLSKVLTFSKQKTSALQAQIYNTLPQQVRGVMSNTQIHRDIIVLVNKIFNSCDINFKERDFLLVQGKKSQAKYILISNGTYRPKSVCCQETVVVKCIDKSGIQEEKRIMKKLHLICLGCKKIILRMVQRQGNSENLADKKRRLLDFALHIASGRYKKHKMDEDPINETLTHVKSRVSQYMKNGIESLN